MRLYRDRLNGSYESVTKVWVIHAEIFGQRFLPSSLEYHRTSMTLIGLDVELKDLSTSLVLHSLGYYRSSRSIVLLPLPSRQRTGHRHKKWLSTVNIGTMKIAMVQLTLRVGLEVAANDQIIA